MSEFKGTPGKWYVELGADGAYHICGSQNGRLLVVCSRKEWKSREAMSEANARLIASAPDLLTALEDAVGWFEAYVANKEHGRAFDMTRARAAIAKALGKDEGGK